MLSQSFFHIIPAYEWSVIYLTRDSAFNCLSTNSNRLNGIGRKLEKESFLLDTKKMSSNPKICKVVFKSIQFDQSSLKVCSESCNFCNVFTQPLVGLEKVGNRLWMSGVGGWEEKGFPTKPRKCFCCSVCSPAPKASGK